MTGVLCLEHDCLIKSHLLLLEEIEGQCESLILERCVTLPPWVTM